MKVLIFILILFSSNAFSQTRIKRLVDRLSDVKEMPDPSGEEGTACGDRIFWRIIQHKSEAIPFLINKISDSTQLPIPIYMFGSNWAVGEVAYYAIEEIIHGVPTFELLGTPFDTHGCGYCSYWQHLRKGLINRKIFQYAVAKWYDENRKNLVWISNRKITKCKGTLKSAGHYELLEIK